MKTYNYKGVEVGILHSYSFDESRKVLVFWWNEHITFQVVDLDATKF